MPNTHLRCLPMYLVQRKMKSGNCTKYTVSSSIAEKFSLTERPSGTPLAVAELVEQFSESDKLWAEVVSGKLSWGQFNQRRKDMISQSHKKMVQVNMRS